ncbi:gir2p [Saccharomyces arboricola H-6]|uniref:Gir2p n=1 Tax=Saccharomyces arboricola (strain H-6 / AS 2.3317 / CBS 10644) TaxID=1160507 RepID=J8Q3Z9_SACAR|nr:gir2p [Saccharomyces arboricola H-6]
MDYKEEQKQELEVLESIYPDELRILNDVYPKIRFEVDIKLELDMGDSTSRLTKEHTILAGFKLPENYPDEPCVISLEAQEVALNDGGEEEEEEEEGDEEEDEIMYDDHGNRILKEVENLPDIIRFKGYLPELTVQLETQIETDMLLGMQMCFALISSIKENCEQWYSEQLGKLQKQHDLEAQEREKKEQAKFHGTKVTRESYLEWRSKFREELKLDERDQVRRMKAHHGKLTGKQMFEQGVVGTGDEDMEEDGVSVDDVAEGIAKTEIVNQ